MPPRPTPNLEGQGFPSLSYRLQLFKGAFATVAVEALPGTTISSDIWLHWQSLYETERPFPALTRKTFVTPVNLTDTYRQCLELTELLIILALVLMLNFFMLVSGPLLLDISVVMMPSIL